MSKNAKLEKASKTVSEICLQIDQLAGQVSVLESIVTKGGRVAEKDLLNLIELLKLDGVMADGDAKLQRKMQVRKLQKYVETLDMLKIKNSKPSSSNGVQQRHSNVQRLAPIQEQPSTGHSTSGPVVVTTKWEIFDSSPSLMPVPSSSSPSNPATINNGNNYSAPPKFPWEFFD